MRVGIAIDAWKLTIFDRWLRQAGFAYGSKPCVTPETLLLTVEVPSPHALLDVVKSANQEAANARRGVN